MQEQSRPTSAIVVDCTAKSIEELEESWSSLDDAALNEEIIKYQSYLNDVIASLNKENPGNDIVENHQKVNREATGAEENDPLRIEGVDYCEGNLNEIDPSEWQVPPHCVPIHANVVTYDWSRLYSFAQFDVIMMDPPWQLATANPTRGVALGYSQLTDRDIQCLPIPKLQSDGFLFIWVINAKYQFTLDLFERWGYDIVDEIVWIKMTVNRRLAKSHGFYLQHAKEVCLVGKKGRDPPGMQKGVASDIIHSERRGQSQKPEEIYQIIEQLVPNGKYLEIFGRKNNLRNFWVTVGNEVTGQGPPKEGMS